MRLRSVTALGSLALLLTSASPMTAGAAPSPRTPEFDRMYPGGQLTEGQTMISTSSQVYLELSGGVVTLYAGCNTVLWSPPVTGVATVAYSLTGVLKLKDGQGRVLAAFGGPKAHPRKLVVQNDGNLVATAAKGWYFQTDTHWAPVQAVHGGSVAPRCR